MGRLVLGARRARVSVCIAIASVLLGLSGCADDGGGDGGGNSGAGAIGGAGAGAAGMTGGAGGVSGSAGTGGTSGSSGAGGMTGGSGGMTGGTGGVVTGGAGGVTGGSGGASGATGGSGGGSSSGEMLPFPRDGQPVNVERRGPYAIASYDMMDEEWLNATMYYPMNAPFPFAVMTVSPGFTESKEHMTWWCEMLASHGFAVLSTTPNDTLADQPPDRGTDLEKAVARAMAENTAEGSPLKGKIAVDRIAVSGHSMGGGGTLYAASRLGDQVRAAIPLMEHGPYLTADDIAAITAPTLFIAGDADPDLLGGPNMHSIPHFNQMTSTVERVLMIFAGGDHFLGVNGGAFQDEQSRYAVSWLKIHLEDDMRYETYIYGADHTPEPFSTFETAP